MDATSIWVIVINSVESIVTIAAILVAGIFAWRNGIIFRHRSPHINITHEVTHRAISESYNHLAVTVELHNTSNVKVEFRDGLFVLQDLGPMADDEVERLYETALDTHHDDENEFQWETIRELWVKWGKDELSVEPGQTAARTIEFVVPWDVESVLITTYMYNSRTMGDIDERVNYPVNAVREQPRMIRWWKSDGPRGWLRVSAHDIVPFELDGVEETEQFDARRI